MRLVAASVFAIVLAGAPVVAADDDGIASRFKNGFEWKTDDEQFSMKVGSRVQLRFTQSDVDQGEDRGSFRVRRLKFTLSGVAFGNWKYKLQNEFKGTGDSGDDSLDDAYLQYTKHRMAQVWFGQGRPFFGRQQMTSSGKQQFVDRSLANGEFAPGRDIGIGLIGKNEAETFEYNVGVYNGNGGNETRNDNGNYMAVGRIVFTPFGEYKLSESAHDYPEDPRFAIGVSGMINSPPGTRTFLNDPGNPNDDVTVATDLDSTTIGIEAAFKLRGFNAVAEYYTRNDDFIATQAGATGDFDSDGGYLQLAYLFPNKTYEVAGRYAIVEPDAGFGSELSETGLAVSYYASKHEYKVQLDVRSIENDTVPNSDTTEGRIQIQLAF